MPTAGLGGVRAVAATTRWRQGVAAPTCGGGGDWGPGGAAGGRGRVAATTRREPAGLAAALPDDGQSDAVGVASVPGGVQAVFLQDGDDLVSDGLAGLLATVGRAVAEEQRLTLYRVLGVL